MGAHLPAPTKLNPRSSAPDDTMVAILRYLHIPRPDVREHPSQCLTGSASRLNLMPWAQRGAGGRSGNLPVDVTSFVGRRSELAEVKRLLSSSRLVTLAGVGGVGETRLALRVAGDVQRAFPTGSGSWISPSLTTPGCWRGRWPVRWASRTSRPGGW
jgi:hypothetical protein